MLNSRPRRSRAARTAKKLKKAWRRLAWRARNALAARRLRALEPGGRAADLLRYERKVYSQNGEDGILDAIFVAIGAGGRAFVEFGVEDASQCNTAHLYLKRGWTGLWMDGRASTGPGGHPVRGEFVTAGNVEALFDKYNVPRAFDLLCIDIDGNDYWVWRAIRRFEPRVVVVEYNASIPPPIARTIRYDPDFVWNRTSYFGASLSALAKLGESKGYALVACDRSGTNAFFVERGLAQMHFSPRPAEELYRPPNYSHGTRYPDDPAAPWVDV